MPAHGDPQPGLGSPGAPRGPTPVKTGVAFLPMVAALLATAALASAVLQPRFGVKKLVVAGMVVASAGMAYLTTLGVGSSYAAVVMPGLLVAAAGFGLVFPAVTNSATAGLGEDGTGVGSAMVNTTQQIGGSLGIALLNTMATSAASSYLASKPHTLAVAADAAVHGYTVAFWWAAGIFALGALLAAFVLPGSHIKPEVLSPHGP